VQLRIPDTLIFGLEFEEITLMYTDRLGVIRSVEEIKHHWYPSIVENW
jgi:hypothetical protein